MLSIPQRLAEAVRIIILLPLVSWREPCASPAPANVLWPLSRVVITGTFNSCINYIFSSYQYTLYIQVAMAPDTRFRTYPSYSRLYNY